MHHRNRIRFHMKCKRMEYERHLTSGLKEIALRLLEAGGAMGSCPGSAPRFMTPSSKIRRFRIPGTRGSHCGKSTLTRTRGCLKCFGAELAGRYWRSGITHPRMKEILPGESSIYIHCCRLRLMCHTSG